MITYQQRSTLFPYTTLFRSQEFYEKLFDWKIETMGPAAMIAAESGGIGGHITALGHEPNHYTMFYVDVDDVVAYLDRKSTRLNSSHRTISYAVFCLKKKKIK